MARACRYPPPPPGLGVRPPQAQTTVPEQRAGMGPVCDNTRRAPQAMAANISIQA